MPALETLAVIAYKQPVTAPEIGEIRSVNTSGVLKTLLDKRLITTAGRKEVIGRPILYKTSKEFLMRFGLSDLEELPSLKEFEALAREALGSDEGVAPSEPVDESVLDAPRGNAISRDGDVTEQAVRTAPQATVSESQASAEEGAVASGEQEHKTAAAGE
jgi:segregation and condensation protein B